MESSCSVFAYVTAENASLYRAIMRLFVEAKESFKIRLRPQDLAEMLRNVNARVEVESALAQLCEWGNLKASADISDICTTADFYKRRQVFEMTIEGEVVERAVASVGTCSNTADEPDCVSLVDIRYVLQRL